MSDPAQLNFDDVEWDEEARAWCGGVLFTGEVVEYNPAGRLLARISYRDGFPDGREVQYFADGALREEAYWSFGSRRGIRRLWHSNGQLAQEIVYNDRGLSSMRAEYAPDGSSLP